MIHTINAVKKAVTDRLNASPKLKEWCWFGALWAGGLLTVTVLTYPIKLLIRLAR